jgi:hypothetical protein
LTGCRLSKVRVISQSASSTSSTRNLRSDGCERIVMTLSLLSATTLRLRKRNWYADALTWFYTKFYSHPLCSVLITSAKLGCNCAYAVCEFLLLEATLLVPDLHTAVGRGEGLWDSCPELVGVHRGFEKFWSTEGK